MARDTYHRILDADGRVLLERLRFARSPWTRAKGLLGRRSVPAGDGVGFRERSIHMFFMLMPLDIVFCDAELRVVRVVERLLPWRLAGCRSARYVLEIGAGEAGRLGLRPGQKLRAEPPL